MEEFDPLFYTTLLHRIEVFRRLFVHRSLNTSDLCWDCEIVIFVSFQRAARVSLLSPPCTKIVQSPSPSSLTIFTSYYTPTLQVLFDHLYKIYSTHFKGFILPSLPVLFDHLYKFYLTIFICYKGVHNRLNDRPAPMAAY